MRPDADTPNRRPGPGHTRLVSLVAALASLVALAGCGPEPAPEWDEPFRVDGPVETDRAMIYLNRTRESLHILEPDTSENPVGLERNDVATGPDPHRMALSADEDRLFVLNHGDSTLSVFELDSSVHERNDVALDSNFDRITVDPAGEFLILSFSGDGRSDCLACNLNEIGIVDLRDGVPERARTETLPKRAEEIVFAPGFSLDGTSHRLAAALSPSQISVLDLPELVADNDNDGVRKVPLTVSQAERVRAPREALFHLPPTDDDTPRQSISLYVLTTNQDDVTQVSIAPAADPEGDRKFDLSINQLAAGRQPTAMTILEFPEKGTRLLTLDGDRPRFHLIDVDSGESSGFSLPLSRPASDLLSYEVASAGDDAGPESRLLAWTPDSGLLAVIRPSEIAIGGEEPTAGRSVQAIRLDQAPASLRLDASADRRRAIAVHAAPGGGFTVVELDDDDHDTITIQGASLGDVQFAGPVAFGLFEDRPNFGRFELADGHPTNFPLPRAGDHIFYDADDGLVVVDHGATAGDFTVADIDPDAPDSTPDRSRVFEGVFTRNLLDHQFRQ